MKKFEIKWTEYKNVTIEAESEEEAIIKFYGGDWEGKKTGALQFDYIGEVV